MNYREVMSRLTGFSCPIGGVSWNPAEGEIAVARRVMAFLEDRRVLFNPYHLEVEHQCITSVDEIRRFLTTEIGGLGCGSTLAPPLRAIRAACRQFLDDRSVRSRRVWHAPDAGPFGPDFFTSLGELRARVGSHVAAISVAYAIDVEGQLAAVLPPADEEDSGMAVPR